MSEYSQLDDTMSPSVGPKTDSPRDKGPKKAPWCVWFGCSLTSCCFIETGNPDGFSGVEYPNKDPFEEPYTPCCVCCGVVIMTQKDSSACATECGNCMNCVACIATVLNGCYECFKILGKCLECLVKVLP